MWATITMTLLMFTGMFLILIVLLQRGRGGGLAGAFGGMGGQSAFGTKAGDVFTKITIIVAVIWVALAGLSIHALRADNSKSKQFGDKKAAAKAKDDKSDEKDADKKDAKQKADDAKDTKKK
jgi:preprotein translocase subunit SecG